jgi:hypothetical protein
VLEGAEWWQECLYTAFETEIAKRGSPFRDMRHAANCGGIISERIGWQAFLLAIGIPIASLLPFDVNILGKSWVV